MRSSSGADESRNVFVVNLRAEPRTGDQGDRQRAPGTAQGHGQRNRAAEGMTHQVGLGQPDRIHEPADRVGQRIERGDDVLATQPVRGACVSLDGKPIRIPDDLLAGLAALGVVLIADMEHGFLPDHGSIALVHFIVAVYGFMGLLVLGFSYILVPMFALSPAPPAAWGTGSPAFSRPGLVLASAGLLTALPLLVAAGLGS